MRLSHMSHLPPQERKSGDDIPTKFFVIHLPYHWNHLDYKENISKPLIKSHCVIYIKNIYTKSNQLLNNPGTPDMLLHFAADNKNNMCNMRADNNNNHIFLCLSLKNIWEYKNARYIFFLPETLYNL